MHDCRDLQEQLVDLIFNELEPASSERLLAEIKRCPACWDEYLSMSQTLEVFDQVAERITPPDHYWSGYEARLHTRLARQASSGLWQRLSDWLSGFNLQPVALPLAVALVLLAVVLGGWWIRQRQEIRSTPPIVNHDPGSAPTPLQPDKPQSVSGRDPGRTAKPKPKRAPLSRQHDNLALSKKSIEAPNDPQTALTQSEQFVTASPFINPETAKHFEKAQLLLRSFRNADEGEGAADLDYEKRMSRSLVFQNILLRREAEEKGILPAEELLGTLEPLLLDIANLPDKASRDDVRNIKERIARQEIIAVLHTYAAQPAIYDPSQN